MSDLENSFWQKYRDRGLQVVGINRGENTEIARDFATQFGLTYPVLMDAGNVYQTYRRPGITPFPLDYVLDSDGIIAYSNVEYDPEQMETVVQQLLENPTTVETEREAAPAAFHLVGNNPNPFRTATEMVIDLPGAGNVEVTVMDVLGRTVARLMPGTLPAGLHRIPWNGRDQRGRLVSPGVYLYRVRFGGHTGTGKMLVAH